MWLPYIVAVSVAVLFAVSGTEGVNRRCWTCENERSNESCKANGNLTVCLVNQFYCQTEVRAIASGAYFEITKRCKQTLACENNQMQNYTGTYPFQCATELPHSVCRCCCGFDNCNGPSDKCIEEKPECPNPPEFEGGMTICQKDKPVVDDTCYYKCFMPRKLVGNEDTTCLLHVDGYTYWDNPPPSCEMPKCYPNQTDPVNGEVDCTDANNPGSVCSFICFEPWFITWPPTMLCTEWGLWDPPIPPVCQEAKCKKPMPDDPNDKRIEICTPGVRKYLYGIVCNYDCEEGWEIKDNATKMPLTCGDPVNNLKASWDKPAPICTKKSCGPLKTNATKTCTEGDLVGSKCTLSCFKGYHLRVNGVATNTSTAEVDCWKNSTWVGAIPSCHRNRCRPPARDPGNGSVGCDDEDFVNSTCLYDCDSGYDLFPDRPRRKCEPDNNADEWGVWVPPQEPGCVDSQCPIPPNLPGADYTCTDGRRIDSVCNYECTDRNFELIGVDRTVCTKRSGNTPDWIPPPSGRCELRSCIPYPGPSPTPEAGSLTCSGDTVGSVCRLSCNKYYEAKDGVTAASCRLYSDGPVLEADWNDKQICCVGCLKNERLDVVVLLDNAETVPGQPDIWQKRTEFALDFIDYLADQPRFEMDVSFYAYNTQLQSASKVNIPLVDYGNRITPQERAEVNSLPYKGSGDSDTGKALQQIEQGQFADLRPNRVPMVFLVTSRRPSDVRLANSQARVLKSRTIHLRIIPLIDNRIADPGANEALFEGMVTEPKFVIRSEDNAEDKENFYDTAAEDLVTVSKAPCNSLEQNEQECEIV